MKVFQSVFTFIVSIVAKGAIPFVEWGKSVTGWKTYRFEEAFVLFTLVGVTVLTGGYASSWKWIEVAAVFLTFVHASIGQRLEERQRYQLETDGHATVECFYKLGPVFVGKEFLWMIAFIHAQLWSALVGVFIFLMYYPWRAEWRKKHPLSGSVSSSE